MRKTRDVFLRGVALCFCAAFASLYVQWDGLFGADGLEPARAAAEGDPQLLLGRARALLGGIPVDLAAEACCALGLVVSLLAAACPAAFATGPALLVVQLCYLACYQVGGTFLSFQWDILLLEVGWLAVLWAPWLPARDARKAAGPPPSPAVTWLLRFLLFKLMFQSGVVKIQADCPTWKGLTALDYHYATQCIPTPLAWVAHQLPPLVQQVSVAACLVIEIPLAFVALAPFRTARAWGAAAQIFLQVLIMLTGNYNFFNALTCVLCVPLLDDDSLASLARGAAACCCCCRCRCRRRNKDGQHETTPAQHEDDIDNANAEEDENTAAAAAAAAAAAVPRALEVDGILAVFGGLVRDVDASPVASKLAAAALVGLPTVLSCLYMFEVHGGDAPLRIKLTDRVSLQNTNALVAQVVPWTVAAVSVVVLLLAFRDVCVTVAALVDAVLLAPLSCRGCRTTRATPDGPKARPACWCGGLGRAARAMLACARASASLAGVCVVLSATAVSFVSLTREPYQRLLPGAVWNVYRQAHPWHVSSSYGLFRRMTGVGKSGGSRVSVPARPEVSLRGLDSATGEWHELRFKYKPNLESLSDTLPVVAPHQPRLDWQMWFAALGSYQGAPWLVHLADKLLEGSPAAFGLLAPASAQHFSPAHPPEKIKALKVTLDFTRLNTSWARKVPGVQLSSEGAEWWYARDNSEAEYLPAVERGNPSVDQFLKSKGWWPRLTPAGRAALRPGRRCELLDERVLWRLYGKPDRPDSSLVLTNVHVCAALDVLKTRCSGWVGAVAVVAATPGCGRCCCRWRWRWPEGGASGSERAEG